MKEIWKSVPGYEGLYEISNCGNLKRIAGGQGATAKILKPAKHSSGYITAILHKDGTLKNVYIHRLVAEAFIPNPKGAPQVNHKDGNKHNNSAWNLEWCTAKENIHHALSTGLNPNDHRKKAVNQYGLDGTFIRTYPSAAIAGRINGFDASSIRNCCCDRHKTAGGYIWRYADEIVQATSA